MTGWTPKSTKSTSTTIPGRQSSSDLVEARRAGKKGKRRFPFGTGGDFRHKIFSQRLWKSAAIGDTGRVGRRMWQIFSSASWFGLTTYSPIQNNSAMGDWFRQLPRGTQRNDKTSSITREDAIEMMAQHILDAPPCLRRCSRITTLHPATPWQWRWTICGGILVSSDLRTKREIWRDSMIACGCERAGIDNSEGRQKGISGAL